MTVGFAREFLQVTQESALGVPVVSPVRGTSQLPIRLSGANQFTARAEPVTVGISYGGGYDVEGNTISDKELTRGKLSTELCYSQASMLLSWAMQKINVGQTLPWVTTEPASQYISCTVDHAYWLDDTAAYKRTRYIGGKVEGWTLSCSEESQKCMLDLDLTLQEAQGNTYDSSVDPSSTLFPQPTDAEYVNDFVRFIDFNGGMTLTGGVFAQFTSFNASGQNNHKLQYFANRWPQSIRSYGRKYKMDVDCNVLSTPDFRAAFRGLTSITAKAIATNGVHTLTFDFKTAARYEGLADDLKMAETYQRKVSLGSRYDYSTNTDFAFTFA